MKNIIEVSIITISAMNTIMWIIVADTRSYIPDTKTWITKNRPSNVTWNKTRVSNSASVCCSAIRRQQFDESLSPITPRSSTARSTPATISIFISPRECVRHLPLLVSPLLENLLIVNYTRTKGNPNRWRLIPLPVKVYLTCLSN